VTTPFGVFVQLFNTVEEEKLDGIIFGDIKTVWVFDGTKFGGFVMLQSVIMKVVQDVQ